MTMIAGPDWEGMWSCSSDPIIEHTLIVADISQEPYSSLAGIANTIQEKMRHISAQESISINLIDSTLSEEALCELQLLPRMHGISIENVEFLNKRGMDRVCRTKVLHRRLSKEHRVKVLRFDVAEDCVCGDNDCDGNNAIVSAMHNDDSVLSWTPAKENEMILFLSDVTTFYTAFKSAPAGSLGRILAAALAVNNTLIAIDCSRTNHNQPAITEEGVALIVDVLEKNRESRLAVLILHDNMNGPHISDELQTRLFRVLTRNAYLLSNPFLSTCRINHNVDILGVEGFEDPEAVAMVHECLAEHLDKEFVLAL